MPGPPGAQESGPAAKGEAVSGTIDVDSTVRGRLAPTDILFVIARSATTHQVIAVKKEEGVRFPHAFEISGENTMMEGTAFVGPFDLTARLSKSGDAIPGKGDIEGTAKGVLAGAKDTRIVLQSVRQ